MNSDVKEKSAANSLAKIDDFRKVLADYKPSQETIDMLAKADPVFLVGPTAAGRNTLINLLLQTDRYHYVVSDTTRKPRMNNGIMEQNGVEYWFKTEEEFLAGLEAGSYLEAAIIHNQQVSGISSMEVINAIKADKKIIDEIEVVGARTLRRYINSGLYIFLLPPTFDIWMKRLKGRGDIDSDELSRRLESAKSEIGLAIESDFYHFVINNDIDEAAQAVDEMANGRAPSIEKQGAGIDHAQLLIEDINRHI